MFRKNQATSMNKKKSKEWENQKTTPAQKNMPEKKESEYSSSRGSKDLKTKADTSAENNSNDEYVKNKSPEANI